MRTHVKMFQDRFAPMVKDGRKKQTIRKYPKRDYDLPAIGDMIDCRQWEGLPYRSKQKKLAKSELTGVYSVLMGKGDADQLLLSIGGGTVDSEDDFAKADGFDSAKEMTEWFDKTHGLPFEGILLKWK